MWEGKDRERETAVSFREDFLTHFSDDQDARQWRRKMFPLESAKQYTFSLAFVANLNVSIIMDF